MTYVVHVTLTTGHSRRSPRTEVADHAVAALAEWLSAALRADVPVALAVPGYVAQAVLAPGGLLVTVFGPAGASLVTFGVARRSRNAAGLWLRLCRLTKVEAGEAPPAPWVAAVPLAGMAADLAAARWLGDFERCVAWAWIERGGEDG